MQWGNNYQFVEDLNFLQIIEEFLPITDEEWTSVIEQHNESNPDVDQVGERNKDSFWCRYCTLSWKCWWHVTNMSQNFCPVGEFSKKRACVQHTSFENLFMYGVPDDDLEKIIVIFNFLVPFWALCSKKNILHKQKRKMHSWKCYFLYCSLTLFRHCQKMPVLLDFKPKQHNKTFPTKTALSIKSAHQTGIHDVLKMCRWQSAFAAQFFNSLVGMVVCHHSKMDGDNINDMWHFVTCRQHEWCDIRSTSFFVMSQHATKTDDRLHHLVVS